MNLDLLTPHEMRIAGMVAQGFTDKMIADALRISGKTARTHMVNIYRKTGIKHTGRNRRVVLAVSVATTENKGQQI